MNNLWLNRFRQSQANKFAANVEYSTQERSHSNCFLGPEGSSK